MEKEEIREFYQRNMYGIWREGEKVSYEILGPDTKKADPKNPFEVIGGDLIRIKIEAADRKTEFIVHLHRPKVENAPLFSEGAPFIICMHPIKPIEYFLSHGYAVLVLEIGKIASDDTRHQGAFYDLYPYGKDESEQTGVLMAWAWGASKVLDAVYAGLNKEYSLNADASMVTGVSRWGKATAVCGAFDERFRVTIPTCSGAGGLALYNFISEGKSYDFSSVGGPKEYTYGQNEPLDCLQSEAERGWFNDNFLKYHDPQDIPIDQEYLPILAMDKVRYYFIIAAYTGEDWVNAPAMWECYKKASAVYEEKGLGDNIAVHFHKEGHAVIEEDVRLLIKYFERMYYGAENGLDLSELKTTAFAEQ